MKNWILKFLVYITRHGGSTGQSYIICHLRSLGLRVQRSRVRESIARLDPKNSAVRWGVVVYRRNYYVPWPNSLWHLDGHHSLIRWGFVVYGCIDGFSRRVMFLKCNPITYPRLFYCYFWMPLKVVEDCGLPEYELIKV